MADLPVDRDSSDSVADHVADHNTLHATHNLIDGDGSDGDVLTRVGGSPAWAAQSGTPVWAAYTPTWTNLTIGAGTQVARWVQIGDVVHFTVDLIFAADTSISGNPRVSLPVAAFAGRRVVPAIYNDSGTRIFHGHAWIGVTDANTANLYHTEATNGTVDGTNPFTWTTNDRINISGTYEAA